MLKKYIGNVFIAIITLFITGLAGILVMIFAPSPTFRHVLKTGAIAGNAVGSRKMTAAVIEEQFVMRDGVVLHAQCFPAASVPITVLFLHGVMSSSREYLETGRQIHERTGAQVILLNLRGHGESGGVPGDVSYIGQYAADTAEVIRVLRQQSPGGRILLAGHSMGGGIALRYAADVSRHHYSRPDGYLLFAPHLGNNSPTIRTEPKGGGSDSGSEAPMKLHLSRTIGLALLNGAGIRCFNGLDTLFFNVPSGHPLAAYSYRAMMSMAPEDYKTALTADDSPLLVIVGTEDEAFDAERFPSTIHLHRNGETCLVNGETHDSVLQSTTALNDASRWIQSTCLRK